MKSRTVSTSMVPVLLPISTAGVPATAAMDGFSVQEFEVTGPGVTGMIPVPAYPPMCPEDLPGTNFSKLRIIPRNERYDETSVHPGFEVRTQPTEPFVKAFTTETYAPVAIELVSNWWGRYGTCRSGGSHDEDPFFDVALAWPNGDAALNLTGIVNLGGGDCIPPPPGLVWAAGGGDVYNERRGEYRERYITATDSSIEDWEREILPHYVEEFEYTIEIGEAG